MNYMTRFLGTEITRREKWWLNSPPITLSFWMRLHRKRQTQPIPFIHSSSETRFFQHLLSRNSFNLLYFNNLIFQQRQCAAFATNDWSQYSMHRWKELVPTNSERKHATWQVPMRPTFALYRHETRQIHLFQMWFLVAQNTTGFFLLRTEAPLQRSCLAKKMVSVCPLQVTMQKEHQSCFNTFFEATSYYHGSTSASSQAPCSHLLTALPTTTRKAKDFSLHPWPTCSFYYF